MKARLATAAFVVIFFAPIILFIWPPNTLKKEVLNRAVRSVSEKTPYEVMIGRVSGNILTGFTLDQVRVIAKSDHADRLRAKTLKIRISGLALLHKKVQLYISGGPLAIINPAFSPAKELVLNDVALKMQASAESILIDHLDVDAGGGHVTMEGRMFLHPERSGGFFVKDENVFLEKIAAAFLSVPEKLHLAHSGRWTIRLHNERVTVDTDGELAGAPFSLAGTWNPQGTYRARVQWEKMSLYALWRDPSLKRHMASASVDLYGRGMRATGRGDVVMMLQQKVGPPVKWADGQFTLLEGVGNFSVAAGTTNAQGSVDLLHLSTRMVAERLSWPTGFVQKLTLALSSGAGAQHLEAAASGIQLKKENSEPVAIASLQIALTGISPRWKMTGSAQMAAGPSLTIAGFLSQQGQAWRVAWTELTLGFTTGGSWKTREPGDLKIGSNRRVELHHLDLANEAQTLQISQASFDGSVVNLELLANRLDPGPLAKLVDPALTIEGEINASVHLVGPPSHPNLDGYLRGTFKTLSEPVVGLSVQNIDMDIESANQTIEVRRFKGKTKKGDIEITGGSHLPQLNYALRARKLIIQTHTKTGGMGDIELNLGGTLSAPELTGSLRLSEATYAPPPAKEKNKKREASKPEASETPSKPNTVSLWRPGAVDIAIKWPRNVWYRDGISSIETSGDLRVQKRQDSPDMLLTGSIKSVRGTYSYYGRSFNIESGEIQLAGTPEINPLMNIEASYASGATTVYLDITGPADQPVLKMHSNPPLSDQDIVSVIVFGQPLNELKSRTNGTSNNQEVMQAVGGVLGSYVSKGLNETGIPVLNFDMLNIQPADQGGSQLTLGRYLTRKLFVSYGQTVQGSAEKTITADYFLTDKWTMEGTSDSVDGNYMDFLFRYPLNSKGAPANNSPLPKSPFRNTLDQPTILDQFRTPLQ